MSPFKTLRYMWMKKGFDEVDLRNLFFGTLIYGIVFLCALGMVVELRS